MRTEWELTEEAFNLFLTWLDADRDLAAKKYEELRRRLIVFFNCRGCVLAEDLADEAINRVIRRGRALFDSYVGDLAPYLYTVAHHLHLEFLAKSPTTSPENLPELLQNPESGEAERRSGCLERCLQKLPPSQRDLVIKYYLEDKQAKIDHRKNLADR